ncbi:MAG: GAF domain-containing protein [Anaerolineae bacterium]|nr:GAF domain-containing protein [Anaerolineae bacterium]
MRKSFLSLLSLSSYTAPFQRWQAVALYAGVLLYGLSRLLLLLPDTLSQTANHLGWEQVEVALVYGLLLAAAGSALALARRGSLKLAGSVLAGVMLLDGALFLLGGMWDWPYSWAGLWIGVALGGLLLEEQESAVVAACAVAVITLGSFKDFGSLDINAQNERFVAYLVLVLWSLGLAGITALVARGGRLAVRLARLQETSRRLVEIGGQITQQFITRQGVDDLLQQVASDISQHFEAVYHVQLYIIEPGSHRVELRAATGAVGEQLLEQEYELDVGGLSTVGRVALSGETLLIPNTSRDPVHKLHPLLLETRSELVIPLVADGVIGILDVQSAQVDAFSPADVASLKAIADQIVMGVDGLRLHQSVQRIKRENQALYHQTQSSLREIERLNYQLTGHAWADYLRLQADSTAMTLNLETGQAEFDAVWTDTLKQAISGQEVITKTVDGRQVVALPIVVRNGTIGAMEFELEPGAELPDSALDLIAAVGQRLGLAMENRRLFDETQRVAQREALINDIGTELQAATGIEAIIRQAARQLQDALTAQQVTIRLGTPPTPAEQPVQEKSQP